MNKKKTYISTLPLFNYVKANEVAWQMYDSLIGFSNATCNGFTENKNNEYDVKNEEMLAILANARECVVFNPEIDDCSGFEYLTEWSESKDLLILVNNKLLLCIAPCEKSEVLSMAEFNK